MNDILKAVLIFIIIVCVSGVVRYTVKETITPTQSNSDTVMGITREEYLDKVSNNGQDKEAYCVYEYLIDTYGIRETYKIDLAAADENAKPDPRTLEAIERCI